ncbi:hypothetical protein OUZ56_029748 [Daphnia magna]|uniref:Uncharacterized protein n=1 Tax=Daphnia magna TaxID=35525 RepID=A0ABR0B7Q7_9CRUS|nr:hypothetical protein OUZ56_029743 [Daphnia magna]KAK4037719.1 hypothetical protein OUZ56_029748 [Daphnia magna]
MAKHRSRKSARSSSSSDSDSSSSSGSSGSNSDSSNFSDIQKAKNKKFQLKGEKSAILSKWIIKGLSEKDVKAAREAFKPSLKRDKKYDGSDLFTNPKLDESLYSALKKARNSAASVVNIDPQEKIYRKQTDLVLDLAKHILFMASQAKNKKKCRSDHHTVLLSRAAEKLPIGSEDLFGDKFIRELLSQVKVASRVSTSVYATPASTSTPIKPSTSRTPASTPSTPLQARHTATIIVLPQTHQWMPSSSLCVQPNGNNHGYHHGKRNGPKTNDNPANNSSNEFKQ